MDWTAVGAKVKKLIDERIGSEVRKLMTPVSVLDQDFEEKIADLPNGRGACLDHGACHPGPDT